MTGDNSGLFYDFESWLEYLQMIQNWKSKYMFIDYMFFQF